MSRIGNCRKFIRAVILLCHGLPRQSSVLQMSYAQNRLLPLICPSFYLILKFFLPFYFQTSHYKPPTRLELRFLTHHVLHWQYPHYGSILSTYSARLPARVPSHAKHLHANRPPPGERRLRGPESQFRRPSQPFLRTSCPVLPSKPPFKLSQRHRNRFRRESIPRRLPTHPE